MFNRSTPVRRTTTVLLVSPVNRAGTLPVQFAVVVIQVVESAQEAWIPSVLSVQKGSFWMEPPAKAPVRMGNIPIKPQESVRIVTRTAVFVLDRPTQPAVHAKQDFSWKEPPVTPPALLGNTGNQARIPARLVTQLAVFVQARVICSAVGAKLGSLSTEPVVREIVGQLSFIKARITLVKAVLPTAAIVLERLRINVPGATPVTL